ncbi:MAG: hypothetical protein JXA99_00875, partial [Candidatus Lokiarchaeota archaeon]|nr:hypothetical protein [Candidatus Lokiarchaeota archaeon]
APENPNSLLFYGFSGDLLSGSMAIDLNDKDYESLPNAIFPYIAQYKGLSLNLLPKLLGYSDNSVKESFLNNFNSYKDFSIEDAYYYLQKNEHDFKRIGSFADGSKLGNSIPVYFFHNRKIINFYKGLPPDFKKNESLHNYLGYFHNLRLGLIPSSGRLNIPVFLLPLILNSVSKESLIRWNNFYRRHKKSVYLKINIGDTFFEIFRDDWNLLNKFIDTVQLNQLIVNNQFEVTSLNILRLRILNIMQLFKLVDHLNTKNLHQISYPLIIKNVDFYQESK